jgi:hypothetical protein
MMCGFIYFWTCFDGWMSWGIGSRYTDFMFLVILLFIHGDGSSSS